MTEAANSILVIGKGGQLAQSLAALAVPGMQFAGRPDLDLADAASLRAAITRASPGIVINAAAYTFVDGAESDAATAFAVNRDGPAILAQTCAARGIPFIHVSTDCVFDGMKAAAYVPEDRPAPLGVYGQSKWEGEQAVAAHCPQHLIVRVSWVFSEYAGNFVRTMLQLARTREEVKVVCDQVGYPTYCPDLSRGLLQMTEAARRPGFSGWGTYHLAGRDEIDRAGMAQRIFDESARLGGPVARVMAVPTSDYPTPARRPLNARLDSAKAIDMFGLAMPDWRPGLAASVRVLLAGLADPSAPGQKHP